MRSVGLKVLRNKLSEYVRIAASGETVLVTDRDLEPFPWAVGTLDALHLASMSFLSARGQHVQLASYDDRLSGAARSIGIAALRL